MKRYFIWMIAAILTLCGTMTLTSCGVEINNDEHGNPEEYQAQIANTRWELKEVMNHNNEWVSPEFFEGLDIPELSFRYNNSYVMRIATHADRTDVTIINGTYSIDSYFSITMTDVNYQGIAYTLKVIYLNGNTLEGEFSIGKNPRRYNIRMKRFASE